MSPEAERPTRGLGDARKAVARRRVKYAWLFESRWCCAKQIRRELKTEIGSTCAVDSDPPERGRLRERGVRGKGPALMDLAPGRFAYGRSHLLGIRASLPPLLRCRTPSESGQDDGDEGDANAKKCCKPPFHPCAESCISGARTWAAVAWASVPECP